MKTRGYIYQVLACIIISNPLISSKRYILLLSLVFFFFPTVKLSQKGNQLDFMLLVSGGSGILT